MFNPGVSKLSQSEQDLKPFVPFLQPNNCPVKECPTVTLYQKELERHRATEATLRASMRRESELSQEKDDLLQVNQILAREAEHRFLNGLQLISSLLSAQSRATSNTEAASQLTIAASRVGALGRVTRHLHVLDKSQSVNFKQYLEQLCSDLSEVAAVEYSSRLLHVEGKELEVPGAMAVPLGFVANELITNSLKHAMGKITVRLQILPNGLARLSVSDDGPGLPAAFDPAATKGLGMKIVASLLKQIQGKLTFSRGDDDQGTTFSVLFDALPGPVPDQKLN